MNPGIRANYAAFSGYWQSTVRGMTNLGEEPLAIRARIEKFFREEETRVHPIYHTRGKVVVKSDHDVIVRLLKYDEKGKAEFFSEDNLVDLTA